MESNKIAFLIGSPFLLCWGLFLLYVFFSETPFITKIVLLGLTISLGGMIYYFYESGAIIARD